MQKTSSALFLFGCILLSMAVGIGIGLVFTHFWSLTPLTENAASARVDHWYIRMLVQGLGHAFTFLFPALSFWYFFEQKTWADFSGKEFKKVSHFWICIAVVITLIPLNQLVIEWNQQMHLPAFLADIENWMRIGEQEKTILTQRLLRIDSFSEIIVALAVFGLIGPLGEEVLFRGVLQQKMQDWGLSPAKTIWIVATLFSLIHFQFFGFFPRLLLGALFGYLFYWAGNLWIPIVAHVVNNSLYVLVAVAQQNRLSTDSYLAVFKSNWIWAIPAFALTAFLLVLFRRKNFIAGAKR